jgi:molybdopterin/thiamine biosynthesis adenylyltransferase
MDKFMVFDVESVGLHGEGFAVAWVVVSSEGERLGEGCMACDPDQCEGTNENRQWVTANVPIPLRRASSAAKSISRAL